MIVDLNKTISQEECINAQLMEGAGESGSKGEPILNTIILTFLSSGAIIALINVLNSYFERDSSLEMTFLREDGKEMTIRANNMRMNQIEKTIEVAREFFGDKW